MTAETASPLFTSISPQVPWATASHPEDADTSPMELSALGAHVDRCNGSRGRWFSAQCAADSLLSFVASRFVTTLVVVAFVFGVVAIVA